MIYGLFVRVHCRKVFFFYIQKTSQSYYAFQTCVRMRTRIRRTWDATHTQGVTVNSNRDRRPWSIMPQADLFQQIRTQFQEKTYRPLSTVGRTKVLARSDVHFISELPNKWRVDYERRQDHKHTGFFAYNHLPYKTFGNLKHTDVYDLMGDRLGMTVTKQHAYSHVRAPPIFLHAWPNIWS